MKVTAPPGALSASLDRIAGSRPVRDDLPDDTPAAVLAALAHHAAGREVSTRLAASLPWPTMTPAADARLAALVDRYVAGEPVAYLTGRQNFLGLEMRVAPGALIPRPETELLARCALAAARQLPDNGSPTVIVDLCTGIGNIAAVLASAGGRRYATDVSTDALTLAAANLQALGLADRVTLLAGDLFGALAAVVVPGTVSLVTCNPPYLSDAARARLPSAIGAHEPAEAFDGGPLGIRVLHRMVRETPDWLVPGGRLLTEVGLGQGPGFMRRLEADPRWRAVSGHTDPAGRIRVVEAVRA